MNIQEEWEHSLQHRCFQIDNTEDLKIGGFVDSGDQVYMIIDIMDDRVKAIKHDGVIH
jgi:hypothetical protein